MGMAKLGRLYGKSPLGLGGPPGKIQLVKEKMGTKRSVLTDEKGLPLAVVISGANTHDIKLLGQTLAHIVVPRPKNRMRSICKICA